jgi:hypothetical protein
MNLRTTRGKGANTLLIECLSTWGDVARSAHNSEGFALAGEDLGDAKVTNLDMIQGPYTQGTCFISGLAFCTMSLTEI